MKKNIYITPIEQLGCLPLDPEDRFDLLDFLNCTSLFFNKDYSYLVSNGRMAMTKLFVSLNLMNTDEVYITTSFDFPNVSACVTSTIFNFCKPSRVLTENTKAIFIIHEFGVPHPVTFDLINLAKERKIPVIEDCAHTINSCFDNGQRVGSVGDWTIVSFPKIFPVHIGGLLLGNIKMENDDIDSSSDLIQQTKIVNSLWHTIPSITTKRMEILHLYMEFLKDSNYEFLDYEVKNIMPWFFPLKVKEPSKIVNILRQNGIECGFWHGTNIVVLPLHQYLNSENINYICTTLKNID